MRDLYTSKLVGKFFHTFEDGQLSRQGEVLSRESEELFLVRFFSWIGGTESTQSLVTLSDMKEWTFYADDELMRYYGELRQRKEGLL